MVLHMAPVDGGAAAALCNALCRKQRVGERGHPSHEGEMFECPALSTVGSHVPERIRAFWPIRALPQFTNGLVSVGGDTGTTGG